MRQIRNTIFLQSLTSIVSLLLILSMYLIPSAHAMKQHASPFDGVHRFILDNGLTVLLKESTKAETASIYLATKAGSADESQWMGSGLSHFVEHMFFKGTKRRDKGSIEREVREMGGYINAYTSNDLTVFYLNILSNHLEQGLDLMSDAAFNPSLDPEELERERQVILSEIRMNEDRYGRKALVTLWQLLFLDHPYRHPVIGYEELFKKVSREDLSQFLEEKYVPNNMILSVVGNFRLQEAEALVRKYFDSVPRGVLKDSLRAPEGTQVEPRSEVLYRDVQHARLLMGYPGVSVANKDAASLDVLMQILGDGPSSRMVQEIKERQQNALEISAFSSSLKDAGLIAVESIALPEKVDIVRESVLREIERVQKDGVTQEEVDTAKNQTLSQFFAGLESHSGVAHDILTNEIYSGNYRFSESFVKRIDAVSPESVQKAAQKYFQPSRYNEVLMLPLELKSRENSQEARTSNEVDITKITLEQGSTLLLMEDHVSPLVYLKLIFPGGVLYENEVNNGIHLLLTELWARGTKKYSYQEISEKVASWGGYLSTSSGYDNAHLTLSFLSKHTQDALELLEEILIYPTFPEDEFKKVKFEQEQAIKAEKESLYNFANIQMMKGYYGTHPYSQNVLGTEESLANLTRDALIEQFRKVLNPESMILAVFGDIDKKEVQESVASIVNKLDRADGVMKKDHSFAFTESKEVVEVLEREQAVVMLTFPAMDVRDPRRHAMNILKTVMSGSAGRLYQSIRSEHGLSYVVSAGLTLLEDPGFFIMYAGVEPGEAHRVKDLLQNEAKKLKESGITEDELQLAKTQLIGNHQGIFESKGQLLSASLGNEFYGLGYERIFKYVEDIKSVTLDDVNAVIEEFVDLNRHLSLIVGPEKVAAVGAASG